MTAINAFTPIRPGGPAHAAEEDNVEHSGTGSRWYRTVALVLTMGTIAAVGVAAVAVALKRRGLAVSYSRLPHAVAAA